MQITRYIPNALTSNAGRSALQLQKASPKVLFGVGVVGVVATAVLASRATLKLNDVLDEKDRNVEVAKTLHEAENNKYSDSDYNQDMAVIYTQTTVSIVKLYIPTVVVASLSIAALTGSHVILTKRNAALSAAYAAVDKSFREYRKRVVEEYGEETDYRFRHETTKKETEKGKEVSPSSKKKFSVNDYSGYAKFFDQTCPAWQREPEFNFLFLRCQQNYANDLLRSRGHVFLNEVYDMLKLERTRAGSVVGWVVGEDGDNYVDFGIFNGNSPAARDFVNGHEGAILLDFNVDGVIYDKI